MQAVVAVPAIPTAVQAAVAEAERAEAEILVVGLQELPTLVVVAEVQEEEDQLVGQAAPE